MRNSASKIAFSFTAEANFDGQMSSSSRGVIIL
eukprot:CAMPEP_0171587296 /NCGR_PEP_ID=MMETSP0961-20121227/13215_1 /TAXON_ID=87120 /ORGANISM="Aurantiochytrium limacinum, Strain ATCCMYA-1381" /LENGTH=32 /DNA_ID= /DNA_START= /DNA_END= /DNA_ORIENTATION=